MDLQSYFSQENIIKNLSFYEMSYQVALGKLISNYPSKKIDTNIEFQYALGSIYELLKDLESNESKEIDFMQELTKQGAMDAVQFFANENLEQIKTSKINIEPIVNEINDNIFFNDTMKDILKDNFKAHQEKWNDVITEEISQAILKSLKDLEK